MNISETCIKRPVLAIVLSTILVLLGITASQRLSLREYPDVDAPVINILTTYPGATSEIIETEVTTPIEDIMSGVEGIDAMNSISRAGESIVNITFKQSRDIEAAAADVRDRIARVVYFLPDEVNTPVIWKDDADNTPFFWATLTSDSHTRLELTEIAKDHLKDRMAAVDGVSQVLLWGGKEYAMRVWVNRTQLASYGLTVQDVETAIRRQNVDIPSGRIEGHVMEMTILTKTSLRTPEEFEDIVVSKKDNYLVRLKDVASVQLAAKDERHVSTLNNQSSLALGVRLQSVANPLEVSKKLREVLDITRDTLPKGVNVKVVVDNSYYIQESIDNVFSTLVEAVILVILVIFIFLRSFKAVLIPAITIPISLIGVNALMWWWGFSLNTLTLLAFVLGIGIVVDDAIVVMENIHRYIENGMKPKLAAIKGSKEIFFAIVAMTLTLTAVFAPLGFSEGTTGKLFIEFALTLAGAVIISGFTALTLTPMMCSKMLHRPGDISHKRNSYIHRASEKIEQYIQGTGHSYVRFVKKITSKPRISIIAALVITFAAVFLTILLPRELAPYEDVGRVDILAIGPEGTNIQYAEDHTRELIEKIEQIPEISRVFVNYGNPIINYHNIAAQLVSWEERERTQFEVHAEIKKLVAEYPGLIFISVDMPPLGQFRLMQPVNLLLQSTVPVEELAEISEQVMKKLADNPLLSFINLDLKLNKPQVEIALDREKLADADIEVETVGRTLETLFGGRDVTEFQREVRKYDVVVQLNPNDRTDPSDIREIYLRSGDGQLILLEDVLELNETIVPRQLNHFNKLRVANITANPAPGYSLGEALESAVADIEAMDLPINIEYKGASREYLKSSTQIYYTALLSVIFIYLVLAAQFESFRDPFIILIAVPFAVLGAAITLHLTGKTFSIYTQIGMITLVGLISKHGIMLVDTANRLRYTGVEKFDAMMQACAQRFRPIMMTTAAMVLGSIPLALADGAGAESRSQIGWVIAGGLIGGTFLTLLVTPSIYMLLSRDKLEEIH